jgi:hypothetical protein
MFAAGISVAAAMAAERAPSRAVRRVDEQKKPTGRIVGRIKLPARPKAKLPEGVAVADGAEADVEAKLKALAKPPEVRLKSIDLFDMSGSRDPLAAAEIDEDGRFSFDGVPAGPVRLRPVFEILSPEMPSSVSREFSLGDLFTLRTSVRAGETTELAFFGRGRPVTGKIVLPEGIKPQDASVRLTMIEPPRRAMWGRGERPRPTPLAVAFSMVKPDRELESEPLDADGKFRVEGVPEGTYRLHVTIRGQNEPARVWFTGYAEGQAEWVKNGRFDVPLMKDGTSETPLDLGSPRFEYVPKPG